jgi:hypothetical protein
LPAPVLAAAATVGGVPATIQYVGAAPLFISFGGMDNSQTGITVAIR